MKTSISILLLFILSHSICFSAKEEVTFRVNTSTFHVSTASTKMTFENVGSKTAQAILKGFWQLNKGELIIVHNEYFLNHGKMLKEIPKKLLKQMKFKEDDSDVMVAQLTLKFNEKSQNFELYSTKENHLILKSKNMNDVLNRVFQIQYPKGYEERRIKKTKTL